MTTGFDFVKRSVSVLLTVASICLVGIGIFQGYNIANFGGVPIEFLALFMTMVLLGINEGYQVAIISTRESTPEELQKWPRARAIRNLIFSENGEYDRLPRLFLGQSFMVVFCTYMTSALTVMDQWPAGPLKFLCASGLPGILIVVNIAQLLPSIWATKHPMQYLTKAPAVHETISAALFIESLGLLHFTFVAVRFLEWALIPKELRHQQGSGAFGSHPSKFNTTAGDEGERDETEELFGDDEYKEVITFKQPTGLSVDEEGEKNHENGLNAAPAREIDEGRKFKVKMFISTLIQCACVFYLLENIFTGRSIVPFHPLALVSIILVIYYIVFLCEGLKIAIVSMAHMSREDLVAKNYDTDIYDILTLGASAWLSSSLAPSSPETGNFFTRVVGSTPWSIAKAMPIDNIASNPEENESPQNAHPKEKDMDISRFLLGRQMIVVPANFLIATIFTFNLWTMGPFWTTICVKLALPSVICTLQFVQLAPQVLAGRYTSVFLRLPGAKALVILALAVQNLGLTEISFMLCDYLHPDYTWSELLCPSSTLCFAPFYTSRSCHACFSSMWEWWTSIGVETPAPRHQEVEKASFSRGIKRASSTSSGSGTLYIGSPNANIGGDDYVAVDNPVRSIAV